MQNSHNHNVSGQELDNLLKQAFLNLDVTNPKHDAIMETVANQTLTKRIPFFNTNRSFFTFLKWVLAVVSILSVFLLASYFLSGGEEEQADIIQTIQASAPQQPGQASHAVTQLSTPVPHEERAVKTIHQAEKASLQEPETLSGPASDQRHDTPEASLLALETKQPADTAYVFPVLTEDEVKANHKQKKKMIDRLIRFHKDAYVYIPMGSFIYGKDTFSCRAFYMATTEVSNLDYRTFLFDLLINGKKAEFLKAKPDQEQWIKRFHRGTYLEPMTQLYFSHPAYHDYPVVNISRTGAEMYCAWLTIAANEKLGEKNKPLMNDLRIPVDYEWAYAASNKKNRATYANGAENLRDSRGLYIQNYNCARYARCLYDTLQDAYLCPSVRDSAGKFADDGGFLTTALRSYASNAYGVFDMAGNVSEMVYLRDSTNTSWSFGTKGGSWYSPDYFLEIDARQEFKQPEKPSPFVGFRPVMTAVIDNKAKK